MSLNNLDCRRKLRLPIGLSCVLSCIRISTFASFRGEELLFVIALSVCPSVYLPDCMYKSLTFLLYICPFDYVSTSKMRNLLWMASASWEGCCGSAICHELLKLTYCGTFQMGHKLTLDRPPPIRRQSDRLMAHLGLDNTDSPYWVCGPSSVESIRSDLLVGQNVNRARGWQVYLLRTCLRVFENIHPSIYQFNSIDVERKSSGVFGVGG